MKTLMIVGGTVLVLVLLMLFTPLVPRKYVGRSWLKKRLREFGVTYPIPEPCLQEVVSESYSTARLLSKSPYAEKGFSETFSGSLDNAARFFQIWTRKSETFERFGGSAWADLVALAERYEIPRGNEP